MPLESQVSCWVTHVIALRLWYYHIKTNDDLACLFSRFLPWSDAPSPAGQVYPATLAWAWDKNLSHIPNPDPRNI